MKPEELRSLRHDIEVPWDDLRAERAQRVALAAWQRRASAEDDEEPPKIPMQRVSRRSVALGAAVLALVALAALWLRSPADPSTLAYRDGSRSTLGEGATVQILVERDDLVEVEQRSGKVRYSIERRPDRTFRVRAGEVTVTVLGTVFEVTRGPDGVDVSVERGSVRAESATTSAKLGPGDRIRLLWNATEPEPPGGGDPVEDPADDLESTSEARPDLPASPSVRRTETTEPDAKTLLERADQARGRGDLNRAAQHLRTLVARHPKDRRVTLALFTLGQVERQRGNHLAAARAFEQCGLGLRGDALAEAAVSYRAAGDAAAARRAAQRYLDTFPNGLQADRLRALTGL
ncbi:MAG: FecR domain-containing protein [Myxococcota bacterium]